jgi:anterior pharynx defective protein 1
MTAIEFCGCGLIAFGPALAMFVITIANDPLRVIVLMARYVMSCQLLN